MFNFGKVRPELGAPGFKENFKAFKMDTHSEVANVML